MSGEKWNIVISDLAQKSLNKIDKTWANKITNYIYKRVASGIDPRRFGEPLAYDKHGLWRYRIGDYRVICEIYDTELIIVAVAVGRRKDIYKNIYKNKK